MTAIASHIYMAHRGGPESFLINGEPFPYFVADDPSVEEVAPGLHKVNVSIYAHSVDLYPRTEAGMEGRRIVREGLADVIAWLDDAKDYQPRHAKEPSC